MEYRTLGNTGQAISRIAFGCWAIGGHGYGDVNDQTSYDAIHTAIDIGITFFDTADTYGFGRSESILGKALGSKKDEVFIATKGGVRWDEQGRTTKDCSPAYLSKAVEQSLKRLKVDCIPLYQIHWHDGKTPIADIVDALERLCQEGKIRFWGLSNVGVDFVTEVCRDCDVATIQLPFGLNRLNYRSTLEKAHAVFEVSTLVYSVLGRGLFSGKYTKDSFYCANDTRDSDPDFTVKLSLNLRIVAMLEEISQKYNKSLIQVAIRWVLDHEFVDVALIGIKTPKQAIESAMASDWHLQDEDKEKLSSLSEELFGKTLEAENELF